MLRGHQRFAGRQRRTKCLVARLARMSLNSQPLIGERDPLYQKRHLPLLAHLLAVRHPVVGIGAEPVVNMYRPQANGGILLAPEHQAI